MNVARFVERWSRDWDHLEELIARARGRPERLGAKDVRALGARYRAVVSDLARLRQNAPTDPLTERLEGLAMAGRQLVYRAERRPSEGLDFFQTGYWRLIRSRPAPLMAAAALLLIPALLAGWWSMVDPAGAAGLVPEQFEAALEPGPGGTDRGLTLGEQASFSSFLFVNNIRVSILAFAAGIFWCIGAAYALISNGAILGAVGGLLVQRGSDKFFVELIAAHGVLELSAIVVTAAAGLRMGWTLVSPGLETRRASLAAEARRAVRIVLGTAPWLVVARLIEGFVSRRGFDALPMAIVGLSVGLVCWGLVVWRGKPSEVSGTGAPAP